MNCIPKYIQLQLKEKFGIRDTCVNHMRKRNLRVWGHDLLVWLEIPMTGSKHVMKAHILVSNATVETYRCQFQRQAINTGNGSRVTYLFADWADVAIFLARLPVSMPSNKITDLHRINDKPISLWEFFFKLDRNEGQFDASHQPLSSMKMLQKELRSIGLEV